ncbi:sugar phosphate isomerase/epimerase family protein [Planctomicrobium sp. SH668]|uniref:sugar phosphate isomerase/epimerase family protein n=1 Tax=Planctomicrobium sp. SH668 TaxID=3448126 RepID=UPI003F5BA87D
MKFAICQELFVDWDWDKQCRFIRETGYTGVEVAPFTLAEQADRVDQQSRGELRRIAEGNGLEIIGLHWLLAKTTGFHLSTADQAVRKKTAEYLVTLGNLCADLGGNLMVLGSPLQRNLEEGVSKDQATQNTIEVLKAALPQLADRGVDLLIEPLTTNETNFINTCQEAAEIIAAVDHPNLGLHQDVKAMLGEGTPLPELIRDFASTTRHFHANDANLRGPGMGDIDYVPIFQALKETSYPGWVSVEVFDYSPGAELTAVESLRYMQNVWNSLS